MATISADPSMRTLSFSEDHLANPESFLPPDKDKEPISDKKNYIRFSVLKSSEVVCSLSQEDIFKIGDTIAVCNECLNAFLARKLLRHIVAAQKKTLDIEALDINKIKAKCPLCNNKLRGKDLTLPQGENLKNTVDIKNELIEKLQYEQKTRRGEIKRLTDDFKKEMDSQKIFYNDKGLPDEPGEQYLKFITNLKEAAIQDFETSKESKEQEIDSLQERIDTSEEQIAQLNRLIEKIETEELKKSADAEKADPRVKELTARVNKLERALRSQSRPPSPAHSSETSDLTDFSIDLIKKTIIMTALSLLIVTLIKSLQSNQFFCTPYRH